MRFAIHVLLHFLQIIRADFRLNPALMNDDFKPDNGAFSGWVTDSGFVHFMSFSARAEYDRPRVHEAASNPVAEGFIPVIFGVAEYD